MEVSEANRLKTQEDENTKLKRLRADAMLDNVASEDLLGKKVVTPAAKRAVAHLIDQHRMSERRACKAIDSCRMTIRYETSRGDDQDLRERMNGGALAIAAFMCCQAPGTPCEPQEALPPLSGGEADRAQERRPEASDRHTSIDADPDGRQ